jgi:hypothetical protein
MTVLIYFCCTVLSYCHPLFICLVLLYCTLRSCVYHCITVDIRGHSPIKSGRYVRQNDKAVEPACLQNHYGMTNGMNMKSEVLSFQSISQVSIVSMHLLHACQHVNTRRMKFPVTRVCTVLSNMDAST